MLALETPGQIFPLAWRRSRINGSPEIENKFVGPDMMRQFYDMRSAYCWEMLIGTDKLCSID